MAERTNEEVVRAYLRAIVENDADAMAALRDPDWYVDYPQSGERIRGHRNERAIADNYPGGSRRSRPIDAGAAGGPRPQRSDQPKATCK